MYFVTFILFLWKILLANTVDPDQTPHNVASILGLHCLSMTFSYEFPGKNWLDTNLCPVVADCMYLPPRII